MSTTLEKPVKALPASFAASRRMTYEEFLDWADEDTYAEWVDGKGKRRRSASVKHQDISLFLSQVIAEFVDEADAGKVLTAPFQMKLEALRRGREPDLLFVTKERLPLLKGSYLDGPADLAVEIISPESALRDRGAKYAEYEAGGVREYWIIDADAHRADFFVLDDDGRYQRAREDAAGRYESAALSGFWISLGWLWQTPLPTVRQVLRDWEAV